MLSYSDLVNLSDMGGYNGTYTTSNRTNLLCLMALAQVGNSWNWYTGNNTPLTPDEANDLAVDVSNAITELMLTVEVGSMVTGSIMPMALSTAPAGWLYCDGAQYTQAEYPDLYDAIAPEFKDGSNFNVPNFLGRVIGCTSGDRSMNEGTGEVSVTLSQNELPDHAHKISPYLGKVYVVSTDNGSVNPPPVRFPDLNWQTIPNSSTEIYELDNTGSPEFFGDSHNNMQPTRFVPYYIKT
jgi:microcystin-dependent protein